VQPLPEDMDWKKFSDFVKEKFEWFAATLDDIYPEFKKEDEPLLATRADHIFSNIIVDGENVKLQIQEGDRFSEGIGVFLSTLNGIIRKKYDCFFTVEKIDVF
jgi:hypothetical protein